MKCVSSLWYCSKKKSGNVFLAGKKSKQITESSEKEEECMTTVCLSLPFLSPLSLFCLSSVSPLFLPFLSPLSLLSLLSLFCLSSVSFFHVTCFRKREKKNMFENSFVFLSLLHCIPLPKPNHISIEILKHIET